MKTTTAGLCLINMQDSSQYNATEESPEVFGQLLDGLHTEEQINESSGSILRNPGGSELSSALDQNNFSSTTNTSFNYKSDFPLSALNTSSLNNIDETSLSVSFPSTYCPQKNDLRTHFAKNKNPAEAITCYERSLTWPKRTLVTKQKNRRKFPDFDFTSKKTKIDLREWNNSFPNPETTSKFSSEIRSPTRDTYTKAIICDKSNLKSLKRETLSKPHCRPEMPVTLDLSSCKTKIDLSEWIYIIPNSGTTSKFCSEARSPMKDTYTEGIVFDKSNLKSFQSLTLSKPHCQQEMPVALDLSNCKTKIDVNDSTYIDVKSEAKSESLTSISRASSSINTHEHSLSASFSSYCNSEANFYINRNHTEAIIYEKMNLRSTESLSRPKEDCRAEIPFALDYTNGKTKCSVNYFSNEGANSKTGEFPLNSTCASDSENTWETSLVASLPSTSSYNSETDSSLNTVATKPVVIRKKRKSTPLKYIASLNQYVRSEILPAVASTNKESSDLLHGFIQIIPETDDERIKEIRQRNSMMRQRNKLC